MPDGLSPTAGKLVKISPAKKKQAVGGRTICMAAERGTRLGSHKCRRGFSRLESLETRFHSTSIFPFNMDNRRGLLRVHRSLRRPPARGKQEGHGKRADAHPSISHTVFHDVVKASSICGSL